MTHVVDFRWLRVGRPRGVSRHFRTGCRASVFWCQLIRHIFFLCHINPLLLSRSLPRVKSVPSAVSWQMEISSNLPASSLLSFFGPLRRTSSFAVTTIFYPILYTTTIVATPASHLSYFLFARVYLDSIGFCRITTRARLQKYCFFINYGHIIYYCKYNGLVNSPPNGHG